MNFVKHFEWKIMPPRQRVLAGFVLTAIMDGFRAGQEACLNNFLHKACIDILDNSGGEVRRYLGGGYFGSVLTLTPAFFSPGRGGGLFSFRVLFCLCIMCIMKLKNRLITIMSINI